MEAASSGVVIGRDDGAVDLVRFEKAPDDLVRSTSSAFEVAHVRSFRCHSSMSPILCLAYESFFSILASGSADGSLRIWECFGGGCLRTISNAHTGPITCVAIDAFCIATSASSGGGVKLWDFHRGEGAAISTPVWSQQQQRSTALKDLKGNRKGEYDSDWRGIKVEGRRGMRDLAAKCKPSASRLENDAHYDHEDGYLNGCGHEDY